MGIVCGLDLHRRQITFDAMDVDNGDAGAVGSGNPIAIGFARTRRSELAVARWRWRLEGCTGWR